MFYDIRLALHLVKMDRPKRCRSDRIRDQNTGINRFQKFLSMTVNTDSCHGLFARKESSKR